MVDKQWHTMHHTAGINTTLSSDQKVVKLKKIRKISSTKKKIFQQNMHLNFATKMTAPYTHEKRSREALHNTTVQLCSFGQPIPVKLPHNGSPRRLQFYSCCEKY